VTAVLVPAQPSNHLVVAFGDSISDGDGSTVDADNNYPDNLIRRIAKTSNGSTLAVVNEGIVGNRLLRDTEIFGASALARFDRDALVLPGVTHIVLLEGINDIGFAGAKMDGQYLADPAETPSAQDIIDAYRQLISRAHARGIKVIGATIPPCEGVDIPGYYSDANQTVRETVNKWIRTGGAFDGMIDFDAVVRDPDHPTRLQFAVRPYFENLVDVTTKPLNLRSRVVHCIGGGHHLRLGFCLNRVKVAVKIRQKFSEGLHVSSGLRGMGGKRP